MALTDTSGRIYQLEHFVAFPGFLMIMTAEFSIRFETQAGIYALAYRGS